MNWWRTEDLGFGENTLHDSVTVDIYYYTFVQTLRMYNPRVATKINYGLWVMTMCQCRFISWNKCTTLVGDIGNGGRRYMGNFYTFPLNFSVKINML